MKRVQRYDVEHNQKWGEEIEHIPYLQFQSEWKVKVIPPFGDAVVRFQVQLPCGTLKSIYLDSRGSLGSFGYPNEEPYWEVYPYYGDVGRCARADTEQLLSMIANTEKGEEYA